MPVNAGNGKWRRGAWKLLVLPKLYALKAAAGKPATKLAAI